MRFTALLVMIRNFDVLIDFETLFTIKSSVYSPKVYKNNFESEILGSTLPVVVDVWGAW